MLIVEDEPAIREMVAFALGRAGLQYREVETAGAAQVAIADEQPDLILLDWMLPDMSGIDLARRIKKDELSAAIPVIMLTARG
ncbi:MAG TPA: response regulator, partial [Thiohalobacter sp.]|nr:response regulator [Thiohalobacter sp.]